MVSAFARDALLNQSVPVAQPFVPSPPCGDGFALPTQPPSLRPVDLPFPAKISDRFRARRAALGLERLLCHAAKMMDVGAATDGHLDAGLLRSPKKIRVLVSALVEIFVEIPDLLKDAPRDHETH